jgi:integrase
MDESVQNLLSDLSYEDIASLESVLQQIKVDKLKQLNKSLTLFKFAEDYESYISSFHSLKYLKSVKVALKHLIKFFGNEYLLTELTVRRIEQFIERLSAEAPRGYLVYLRNLKAALNRAVVWAYISKSPFDNIKIPKRQLVKPYFITREELQKILDVTEKEIMKEIFIFAFNTGCRVSEIVQVKWENIDFNRKIVTIGDADFTTKSKKQRVIPMTNEALNILRNCSKIGGNGYVFPKPDGFPYHPDHISKKFKMAVRQAGLSEEITFHTLRHSFASNLANKNVSLVVIQELMGHSSLTVTQIYSHTNLNNLRRGINELNS